MTDECTDGSCVFCQMANDVWERLVAEDDPDVAYGWVRAAVEEAFWAGATYGTRNPAAVAMATARRVD